MGNIVWMASYPKSGNTWVRCFLQNYLSNAKSPSDINQLNDFFANESNCSWYRPLIKGGFGNCSLEDICRLRPAVHQRISQERSGTTLVKTHNILGAYEGLPLHNMGVTSGAVAIVRNPLDVVISLADHFGLTVDQAIEFMAAEVTGTPNDDNNVASVLTSWSAHVDSWTRDTSGVTHVIRYEDLLDEPQKQFANLLDFLGFEQDMARLKRAIEFSSFENMQNAEQRTGFVEKSPNSKRFFRAGRKHQWQGVLSDEQESSLIDSHREMMKKFNYLPSSHS